MGHAVHSLLWYWFPGVCFTHGLVGLLHGHVGVDFARGFLGADFWVRILGGGGVLIFIVQIFHGFCDGLCGFWGAEFFCRLFGCFPAAKGLKNPIKKSHQRILTKGLVQETFLHNTPRHSFWQDTADLLRESGCRCTLWRSVCSAQMASVREDELVI